MKNLKYITFLMMCGFLLVTGSCKKEFFTDVNNNPNSPPTIEPYAILSSVEGALGFTQTSTHCFFTSMFTQQTDGYSRQALAYYNYVVTSQDLDDPWGNWYTSVMENNAQLMQIADARGDNRYSGISRILMAFTLQQVVDAWGSVPFSQAFQGLNNLHPKYDTDVQLYAAMIKLVDDGITYMNNPVAGVDKPSQHGEDAIYGGNVGQWIAFGHAIKARLYIHQSKGSTTNSDLALAEVAASFADNSDNAQFPFSTDETGANAIYQYNENRADIDFSASTMANAMSANNDPRFNFMFDANFEDVNGVGLGAFYGEPNAVAQFITYEELQFIGAEAALRSSGDFATAQTFFTAGIQSSMERLGVASSDVTDYLLAHGSLPTTSVDDAIAAVSYEAWISLFMNPEAFTTWRRTGYPVLTPVAGTQIPRRFPYTQSEYTYNGANVPSSTLYSPRLFWDN